MLRPFILVGVGGSGGKTLRAVRYTLDLRLRAAGWEEGIPDAWQFLHIDTPVAQDDPSFPAPYLPHDAYQGLVADGAKYANVITSINAKMSGKNKEEANRQFPDPNFVQTNILRGAGQYRAIGRTVAIAKLGAIAASAQSAYDRLRRPDSLAQLERLTQKLGADTKQGLIKDPVFVVVSSIAGGSGAGQYLDIVDAIKARFGGAQWSMESFGILYAPDVFDGIKGIDGIPRNALATISETVNGYWNKYPHPSVVDMFQAAGLQLGSGGALDRSGVKYPLIVGRQGPDTVFGGQFDIYLAISTTIAAWMTDDKFQDNIGAFVQGNWDAQALPIPDNTPFRKGKFNAPISGALGFGRVTLAREKFIEYSSERFARACIDRMLKAHTESDPNFEVMDEDAHVLDIAEKNEISFIHASGLNELNDDSGENDQVIDALRPGDELKQIASELKFEVASRSSVGLDKNGGLDVDTWHSRLLQVRGELIDKALNQDRDLRQDKLNSWSAHIQEHLTRVTSDFIALHGLRVTEELLKRLGLSVSRSAEQLRAEAGQYSEYVQHISSYVYEELRSAGDSASLRPDSDAVQAALGRVEESVTWASESALRQTAARVMEEINKEFIIALQRFVASTYDALAASVGADFRADGRDNDYAFWPERNSSTVPRKYEPSSNEKMLLETKEFSGEFERLVCSTAENERFMDAILQVMREQLVDFEGHDLITIEQSWIPVTSADPTQVGISGKKPFFKMANRVEDYLERATDWMSRRGTSFYSFITQNLKDYLDPALPPAVLQQREQRLLGHVQTAFKASSPLVLTNPTLLEQVHELALRQGDSVIISAIPFPKGTTIYDSLHSFFVQELGKIPTAPGQKNDPKAEVDKLFRDQNVDSIEFFAMQGKPVQPLVMTSVMQPIATAWQSQSSSANGRLNFWRWSRARLLSESVPMDREAYEAMIRGWFVARFTGMDKVEEDPGLGPKISIQSATGNYLDFPHPLLYAGSLKTLDYPAAVIESSIIAQALCSAAGSLAPLEAYRRLSELGGEENTLCPEVEDIIRNGRSSSDGSDEMALQQRRETVLRWLDDVRAEFDLDLGKAMANNSVYDYPVVWEIREDIHQAIRTLRGLVADIAFNSGDRLRAAI